MWLFFGSVFFNLLGYLYWIVISFFIPPSIVGSAATVLAIYSPAVAILSVGLPIGVRRSLGSAWAEDNPALLRSYFNNVLLLLAAVNVPVGVSIVLLSFLSGGLPGIPFIESLFVGIFLLLEFWPPMFYSLHNSILKTRTVAFADVVLSLVKLTTTVVLLLLGYGLIGVFLGIASGLLTRSILFSVVTRRLWSSLEAQEGLGLQREWFKPLVKSGIAYWVPQSMSLIGQSAGVLALFLFAGPTETGLYQVSLVMAIIIYRLPDSIQTVMFPYLSGLGDGRKKSALSGIRISLALTLPLVFIVLTYPMLPFLFFDISYRPASTILALLTMGALIHPLVSGYTSYIYSEGAYLDVAVIGTTMAAIRIAGVLLLAPFYEGQGAAFAHAGGAIIAFGPCSLSARRTGFRFALQHWLKAITPPLLLFILLLHFALPWTFGVPLILIVSFLAYVRSSLITRADLREIARETMSEETYVRLSTKVRPIIDKLFSSQ
jgi:O-antigen/teichoic acid export membrane protein